MIYKAEIPAELFDSWGFFEYRGYLPKLDSDWILEDPDDECFLGDSGNPVRLEIPSKGMREILAWYDQDPDAFGACVNRGMLESFWDAMVQGMEDAV